MKRKVDIFCICLLILVVLISFRSNFLFFSDHMASDDANLGIALSGFPFSLFMLATTIHFFLAKKKRLSGMVYVIAAPILTLLEVIIHFLQESGSLIRLIMMLILYFIVLIFGLMQIQSAIEDEKERENEKEQVVILSQVK